MADVEMPAAVGGGADPDTALEPTGPAVALGTDVQMTDAGTDTASRAAEGADQQPEGAEQQPEAIDEDDDPVVQECDIFLNRMHDPPDFVGDLYVVQYPLRPTYRPYGDQGDLDKVDLRQKARRLKFTYKLKQNHNYDDDGVISEKLGKRHVLSSTVVANPSCSYAIGVIHQGRMTLTPIRAVNQLRPDFEDYDKFRSSQGQRAVSSTAGAPREAKAGEDSSGDEGGQKAALEVATNDIVAAPVRVEYQAVDKRRQGKGPLDQAAAAAAEAQQEEEPWTRLDYYKEDSPEAADIYEKHVVWPAAAAAKAETEGYEPDHPRLQKLDLDGEKEALLGAMCGTARSTRKEKVAQAAKDASKDGLSLYVLSRMPVERQVEAVVRHFVVTSWTRQLKKRLPPSTLRSHGGDEALLNFLRPCAVLVAGNWVLKSDLAGFKGTEEHARDMLLILLDRKNGALTKEEVEKWVHIFQAAVSPVIREEISRSLTEVDRATGGCRLKNPLDQDFAKRFPNVIKEYKEWWEKHRMEIVQKMSSKDVRSAGRQAQSAQAQQGASLRHRSRLLSEVREALTSCAMTLAELRRTIQKRNPTTAIRDDELQAILQDPALEAAQVRDMWLLGRTGNEANDKFRFLVHSIFRARDSISTADLLDEYQSKHNEKCALSSYAMRNYLRELAEKMDGDNWVLKGALSGK